MASFVGMDPEAIRRVAESLRQSAEHLGIIQDTIQRLMNEGISGWEGADAADFTYQWDGEHRASLQTAMAAMEKMAIDVIEDIAEQEKASGIVPGGPGSALKPGDVVPGTTIPMDGLTPEKLAEMSPEERMKALEAMTPTQLAAYLASLTPEQTAAMLDGMTPEQSAAVLAMMSPAARLAAISAMPVDARRAALAEMDTAMVDEILDSMDQATLDDTIGGDVKSTEVQNSLTFDAEAVGFKIEGGLEGTMTVNADGSTSVSVHGELGGGREFGGSDKGASLTGGVQAERVYEFATKEEAEAFLADLKDAGTDISVDNPNPIDDVWDVLQSHEYTDKIGGYVQGEGHLALGEFGEISGSARVDVMGTTDLKQFDASLTLQAEAGVEMGPAGISRDGSVTVGGSLTDGKITELSLTTTTGAEFSLEPKAEHMPGPLTTDSAGVGMGASGQGELTLKVYPDSPHFDQVMSALRSGDVAQATKLAYADAEITFRTSTTETKTPFSFNHDIEAFGAHLAGAHVNVTHTEEVSQTAYVKYPNSTHVHQVTVGE